jgi:hypothetical protein
MKKIETCGFGSCRKCGKNSFGNSSSFYVPGSGNSKYLTPQTTKCLEIVYGPEDASYGGISYTPDITVPYVNSFGRKNKNSEVSYLKKVSKYGSK